MKELSGGPRVLQGIFEATNDSVFILDPGNWQIVETNEKASELLGYSQQELVGMPVSKVHPEEMERIVEVWERLVSGEIVQTDDLTCTTRLDQVIPVEASFSLLGAMQMQYVLAMVRDIEKRIDAEEALRNSVQRYRVLLNSANDAIFVHELTAEGMPGKFVEVNDVACNRLGYAREELLQLSVPDIVPPQRLIDQADIVPRLHADKRLLFESVHLTKGGHELPVEINAHLFDLDGKPTVLSIARDITARREKEQALRQSRTRLKLLNSISTRINTGMSVEEVVKRTVDLMAKSFDDLRVAYSTIDNEGLMSVIHSVEPIGMPELSRASCELKIAPEYLHTLRMGEPIVANDVELDARLEPLAAVLSAGSTHAVVHVPPRHSEQLVGLLCFDSSEPRRWTQHEIQTLTEVADCLAIALKEARSEQARQRAEEAQRQHAKRLEMVHELGNAILMARSPEEIAEVGLERLSAILPFYRGCVAVFDREAQTARILAVKTEVQTKFEAGTSIPVPAFLHSTGIKNGEGQIVDDLRAFSDEPVAEVLVQEGVRSLLIVPLSSRGDQVGWLLVARDRVGAFLAESVDIANEVARVVAIAIQDASLLEKLAAGNARLRHLTRQLVTAQEEERLRVSRELHDEAGQALTALKINLEMIEKELGNDPGVLRQRMREAVSLADGTMEQIRALAQNLRPPELDTLGLDAALESFSRDFARRTQLAVNYEGINLPLLADTVNISLYRFLQEALTNVAKHARARKVRVSLARKDGTVSLSVEDDGKGFDSTTGAASITDRKGIGLLGIRERLNLIGGRLEVASQVGQGSRLTASVPWEENEK